MWQLTRTTRSSKIKVLLGSSCCFYFDFQEEIHSWRREKCQVFTVGPECRAAGRCVGASVGLTGRTPIIPAAWSPRDAERERERESIARLRPNSRLSRAHTQPHTCSHTRVETHFKHAPLHAHTHTHTHTHTYWSPVQLCVSQAPPSRQVKSHRTQNISGASQ